jgi:hypothetical protein
MTDLLNKSKLLDALKFDVSHAKEKMNEYDPNNPREAIIHHICKDELEYAQSIIDTIEDGVYDME